MTEQPINETATAEELFEVIAKLKRCYLHDKKINKADGNHSGVCYAAGSLEALELIETAIADKDYRDNLPSYKNLK